MKKKYIISNNLGINPKKATSLVYTANKFKSDIFVYFNETKANLKSIMSFMSLGLSKGDEIEIEIKGIDEKEAFDEISSIIRNLKIAMEI